MKVFGIDENRIFKIKDFKAEKANSEIKEKLENIVRIEMYTFLLLRSLF